MNNGPKKAQPASQNEKESESKTKVTAQDDRTRHALGTALLSSDPGRWNTCEGAG